MVTLPAHQPGRAGRRSFGLAAALLIVWMTIGNPGLGFLLLIFAELIFFPAGDGTHSGRSGLDEGSDAGDQPGSGSSTTCSPAPTTATDDADESPDRVATGVAGATARHPTR